MRTSPKQFCIQPLSEGDIIPERRRDDFVEQVFWNINDVLAVATRLRNAIYVRQQQNAIVWSISDIFLDIIPHSGPLISYAVHLMTSLAAFEYEKTRNRSFRAFVGVRTYVVDSDSGMVVDKAM